MDCRPILAGRVHRALRDVELLVCDYDSSSVEITILPAGSFFQPWTPQDHWRGEKVPITLGDQATVFDWGVSSANGHFLRWDDFFNQCEEMDTDRPDAHYRYLIRNLI